MATPRTKRIVVVGALMGVALGVTVAVVASRPDRGDSASGISPTAGPSTSTTIARIPLEPGGLDGGYVAPFTNTVAGTDCSVFPADNVWHSVVDGEGVPIGGADDPVAMTLAASTGPVRATFRPKNGEGLNVVPTDASAQAAYSVASNWLLDSNLISARSSDADRVTMGDLAMPRMWADLESPPPADLRWTNMSLDPVTDNRLYLLDTDSCVASEFIGFNGLALRAGSGLIANRLSRFDLTSNNRRASRWWGEGPCPEFPPNPFFDPGCDGSTEKRGAARGGSGLSGVGGLVRADEMESDLGIDHAIGVVLPKNLIGEAVWPATESDGDGLRGPPAGLPSGAAPVPMGARLRLRQDFALDCGPAECPQATEVVRALKRHGVIVVDSMGSVADVSEAGMHVLGEMAPGWDPADLQRVELGADRSPAVLLSDFEVVDSEDMRALPAAGPQEDGWLQVR